MINKLIITKRSLQGSIKALLFALAICSSIGYAQDDANSIALDTITCDDLFSVSDDQAGYSLLLLYGYLAGRNNQDEQSPLKIENAIKSAIAQCHANPDLKALSALNSAPGS